MADQKFRVGGGYTAFTFNGSPILYATIISEQGPRPVAAPREIQPLDYRHPIEIVFPTAHRAGTLTLTVPEQWASPVWETLPGFSGTADIIDVFERNVELGSITCTKIIRLPNGGRRSTQYHGCVLTDIDDSETVQVDTLELPKRITLMYTHRTRV